MKFFNQKQLAITLTVLGSVPMVAGGIAVTSNFNPGDFPASSALVLHLYAVVIASFVAGMQWGIHFCKRTADSVYILSSLLAILIFLSLWFAGQPAGFGIIIAAFMLLWIEEYRFSKQRVTTEWFWQIRNVVTVIVIISLSLAVAGTWS